MLANKVVNRGEEPFLPEMSVHSELIVVELSTTI